MVVEKLAQSTVEKKVLARAVLFAVQMGCEDGCALGCIDGSILWMTERSVDAMVDSMVVLSAEMKDLDGCKDGSIEGWQVGCTDG